MGTICIEKEAPIISLYVGIRVGEKIVRPKMALDNGATYTMVSWDLAEVLNLRPEISHRRIQIITASGIEAAPVLTVNSMKALGEKAKNVNIIIHDLPSKNYVDGLLGLSFLKNFNVNINFRKGVLSIE